MSLDLVHLNDQLNSRFHDRRVDLADVHIGALGGNGFHLGGRVLDRATLEEMLNMIKVEVPGSSIDTRDVQVLRTESPLFMNVAVNLTGLYYQPSWLAEMGTQNTYGAVLEVLEEKDGWVLVRQPDGYLGWMYKPYLSTVILPQPKYRVCKPFAALREQPDLEAPLTGRLPEAVEVTVSETFGNWLKVEGHPCGQPCRMPGGWVNHAYLAPVEDVPETAGDQRDMIVATAYELYGVPYLWGGTTANGIDCSGLAQLCYRMAGVALPRDADMQRDAGKPVRGQSKPGDLIFFTEEGDPTSISHVGISLGDGRVIHSSRKRNGVAVDEIAADDHLRTDFAGAFNFLD